MIELIRLYREQVRIFVKVCHHLARHRYVTGYGGNLAWRVAPGVLIITPTQMNKRDIRPRDVVFVDLEGNILEGERRPTGEMPMYLRFFNERPDIVSVLHCHPPAVCALAISTGKNWLMRPLFPETTTEVGPVPVVPYAEPLTEELASAFTPFLQRYNAFIMANHGLVVMSRSHIRWTLMNAEVLESTAVSIFLALQAGGIRELDLAAVRALGNVMRTRNLPLFGAPGANPSLEALYFDEEGDPL